MSAATLEVLVSNKRDDMGEVITLYEHLSDETWGRHCIWTDTAEIYFESPQKSAKSGA